MHARIIIFSLGGVLILGLNSAPAQQLTKFQKWLQPSFFRGFDVGYYCSQSPCVRTQQDLFDLKNTGANLAQINVYGESFRYPEYPYAENPNGKATITEMVSFCRTARIYYTIAIRVGPGRYDVADEDTTHITTIWHKDSSYQVAMYGKMLKEIASEFLNDTLFVGLNLTVEPAPLGDPWLSPQDLQQALIASGIDLHWIFKTWIDSVRTVDQELPLIIQSAQLSIPEYWLDPVLIRKQDDPRIVYDFHSYEPIDYTHNPIMNAATYPGTHWNETLQTFALWDSALYHNTVLAKVREFQQRHAVSIFMGEFGLLLPQNNGENYLQDLYEIATGYGWHFALWAWRSDTSANFIEFDYEKFDNAIGGMTRYWQTVLRMFERQVSAVPREEGEAPQTFALHQNYPNPFNPSATISYELPQRAHVVLKVYNLLGEEVATLVDQQMERGHHSINWTPGRVGTGLYFYRLEAVASDDSHRRFAEARKMLLVR